MFSRRQKYLQLLNEFKLKHQETTTTTKTQNLEVDEEKVLKKRIINHFITNLNCFVYENKSVHWISTIQNDDDHDHDDDLKGKSK